MKKVQDMRTANSQPGSITDVAGLAVGHFTDTRRPTGCTVIITPDGSVAGVDVRGAAPGTRETDLLHPSNLVDRVHAIVLAGGSAWGLDAASGVMQWLEEQQIGLPVGFGLVPIVPAAVLFDLPVGNARIRPDAQAGRVLRAKVFVDDEDRKAEADHVAALVRAGPASQRKNARSVGLQGAPIH